MDWLLLIFCLIIAVGVGMVVVGFVEKNKHKSNKQYHTNLIIIGAIVAGIGLIAVIIKFILNMRKKNKMKAMNYAPQDMGYGPQDMGYGPQDMGFDPNAGMYGLPDGMGFDQYGNPISLAPPPPPPAPVIIQSPPPAPAPAPVQSPPPAPAPSCNPQPNNCCNNSIPQNPFNMGMMNPMMGGYGMNPMMGGYGMNPMMPWMYPQPPVFKVKCSKDN